MADNHKFITSESLSSFATSLSELLKKRLQEISVDLHDVPDPVDDGDAVNKKYVDDTVNAMLSTYVDAVLTLVDGTTVTKQVLVVSKVPCTGLSLDSSSITIKQGDFKLLTATKTPSDTTDKVGWTTSDNTVATVDEGVVTGVGQGSCTVTATCGDQSASCAVEVSGVEEVECTYIGAKDFDWTNGITIDMTADGTVTKTVNVKPGDFQSTPEVTVADEGVCRCTSVERGDDEQWYDSDTGGYETVQAWKLTFEAVASGMTTFTVKCSPKEATFPISVNDGEKAKEEASTSFDASSQTVVAKVNVSTCNNRQECVLYVGDSGGYDGWGKTDTGKVVVYVYYYKNDRKLETSVTTWGACRNASVNTNTLSASQVGELTFTFDSDGYKIQDAAGNTFREVLWSECSIEDGNMMPSSLYVGYGADGCPTNATYGDPWYEINDNG